MSLAFLGNSKNSNQERIGAQLLPGPIKCIDLKNTIHFWSYRLNTKQVRKLSDFKNEPLDIEEDLNYKCYFDLTDKGAEKNKQQK